MAFGKHNLGPPDLVPGHSTSFTGGKAGGSVTIPTPVQAGHLPKTHGALQGADQETVTVSHFREGTVILVHIPEANKGRKIYHWGEVHAEVLEFNE